MNSAEITHWVAESMRPFNIVKDQGFQSLMKTGRPDCYIPPPRTVSCDVKRIFVRCQERIAKMLRVSLEHFVGIGDGIDIFLGTQGSAKICNRCMDITEQQGLCCGYGPF